MKLYYFLTPNARKACAVARQLGTQCEFRFVDLGKGEQRSPQFLKLNPNGRVPVLEDGATVIWESNAIMYYLARKAGSDLWPRDERELDMIRWLSWDLAHFSRHTGTVFFERVIKEPAGLGEPNQNAIEEALGMFRRNAPVLNEHLAGREFAVGKSLSVADFALATFLPHAAEAGLPLGDFPHIARWHDRLMQLPSWSGAFPVQ